jgi:hypothetical protein
MMCAMSEPANRDGRPKASQADAGVLANLSRTRPQRASPRRAAARKTASAGVPPSKARAAIKAKPSKAKPANAKPIKAKPTNAKPTNAKPTNAKRPTVRAAREEAVPRQGFEPDGESASGPVQPPGATELVSSAAELASELAKAGVTGGARLLKDLFSRLPS